MKKLIKILVIIILVLLCICIVLNVRKETNKKVSKPKTEEKVKSKKKESTPVKEDNKDKTTSSEETKNNKLSTKEYTYKNDFGDGTKKVTINAYQVEALSGFAGASSNVYYIDEDGTLHYLELVNLTDTKLATNIEKLEADKEELYAYKTSNTKILKGDDNISYK